jgi:hypothetical protein
VRGVIRQTWCFEFIYNPRGLRYHPLLRLAKM